MTTQTKPNRLTAEQINELDLARRSDLSNDDWVQLYLEEFPPHERRDVDQLRALLKEGKFVMHETRDKHGTLLTWSISKDCPAPAGTDAPSFWFGCWTVTRRSAQSTGIGRVHFARVIAALKEQSPHYVGRITEIESTEGLTPDSQPVRRAKFYQALGLQELHVPYEFPLFQPVGATEYVPQAKLGAGVKAQLLIAPFTEDPFTPAQVRSLVRCIYEHSYNVSPTDPYIAERLALIDGSKDNLIGPVKIDSVAQGSQPAATTASSSATPTTASSPPAPTTAVPSAPKKTKKTRGRRRCAKSCRRKSRKHKS